MKRIISALVLLAALAGIMSASVGAMAAEVNITTQTLRQETLGTLNSSGASYEGRIIIKDFLGMLELPLVIDGKDTVATISVIKPERRGSVEVELTKFDGHIYDASIQTDKLTYTPGKGFEKGEEQVGRGSSNQKGGKLDFGRDSGLYSGRVHFYYSMEDLGYKNIDNIPDEEWSKLFWFNLGSPYVLLLTDDSIAAFLETGELGGYDWPGLRYLLTGEEDMDMYEKGDIKNFTRVDSYSVGLFTDVADQWYAPYVGAAYEYGLMKGNEDETFAPDGAMTVAEAIALASRVHNIYYGKSGDFVQGDPWYEVYVGYAIERGIITRSSFEDYNRNITRREMAQLLSACVDLEELEEINAVSPIPDISQKDAIYPSVLALYNAGVLTGSEADGSFLPNDDITRCEVSAIVSRLVEPSLRVKLK